MTGASAAADNKQHLRVVNNLAGVSVSYFSCICCTAVDVLILAVGLVEALDVLSAFW